MSDMMMPFSVPLIPQAGSTVLSIPLAFQNAGVVGTSASMHRRIELPPGKCVIRATWDGPEEVQISFARMDGSTIVGSFRVVLTIPAGPAGVSRSSRIVELAMATHGALLGGIPQQASAATVDAGYTAGVEVIPSSGPLSGGGGSPFWAAVRRALAARRWWP